MGTFLTHKELETMCDRFMSEAGWERAKSTSELKPTWPDRIYLKENEWPLAFEIKPENSEGGELKKGIGQAAGCLPYQVKPYLVLSEQQWGTLNAILIRLPWLGILTYPNTTPRRATAYTELKIKQKAGDRLDKKLMVPSFQAHPKQYSRNSTPLPANAIYDFLLKNQMAGHYPFEELKNMLISHFPNFKITSQGLGYSFKQLGFEKCIKKRIRGYSIKFPVKQVYRRER